jgi:hypothetical protein
VPLIDRGFLDEPEEHYTIHLIPRSDSTSETPPSSEQELTLEDEEQAEADAQNS